MLGILEHYKFTPDKAVQHNLASLANPTEAQKQLQQHLTQSHLYNAESNLFLASANGFHPASLVLGYMNRNRLGTSKNCTTALAYYLSAIKQTYVEDFVFRQVYSHEDSLEEELYSKKKLQNAAVGGHASFMEETDYFDEETIEATIELADNYYLGRAGYPRNITRAARLYEKLAQSGSSHGNVMAGLVYFKG